MKKLILLFCALGMAVSSWGYDFVKDSIYYNITSDTIPYTVEVTNNGTTSTYTKTVITVPDSVTDSISGKTYTVTAIGRSAFCGSYNVTSVTLPATITNIKWSAFDVCTSLSSIVIPSAVDSIGNWAFSSCTKLTSINIPASVKYIGVSAFESCSTLGTLTVDSANTKFKSVSNVLYNKKLTTLIFCPQRACGSKFTIPSTIDTISDYAFNNCTGLSTVVFPNSLKTIGLFAFEYCSTLTSLSLPASLKTIGKGAFTYCIKIKNITVDTANTAFVVADTVLYSKDYKTLIFYPALKKIKSFSIPSLVDSIAGYSFWYCTKLTSINIPNSVKSIGEVAFDECSELTSIILPSSITKIPYAIFIGCDKLSSVTIPASVTSIDGSAFESCSALKNIYSYADTPVSLLYSSNVFKGVDTTTCTLHVPIGSLDAYKTANVWKGFKTIVDDLKTTSGTAEAIASTAKVTVHDGQAVITGAEAGTALNVYNLQGTAIYTGKAGGETESVGLPGRGVYIVRVGGQSVKVVY